MAPLIRSAQVTDEPRILPLRQEVVAQQAWAKAEATAADSLVESVDPMLAFDPTPDAEDLPARIEEPAAEPPRLAPEVEQALMEERRVAYEEAETKGFDVGYQKGLAEAEHSMQAQIAETQQLLNSVRAALEMQLTGLEDVIVASAFEAICKILGTSLHKREGVIAVVREVMSHVKESEPITIRIAPSDYDLLAQDESALKTGYEGMHVTLLSDDRVELGGCLIETSGGSLDGRLETQLQQLAEAIRSAKRQQIDWKEAVHAI